MAHQTNKAITQPAKGDGRNTGMPVSLAPTGGELALKSEKAYGRTGYGANAYDGRVVADPGKNTTSGLADNLRAKAAEGDGGDLLGQVIQHGAKAGEMQSPQLRPYTLDQHVATAHGMKGQTAKSPKPGDVVVGTLPATLGASSAPDPTDANA